MKGREDLQTEPRMYCGIQFRSDKCRATNTDTWMEVKTFSRTRQYFACACAKYRSQNPEFPEIFQRPHTPNHKAKNRTNRSVLQMKKNGWRNGQPYPGHNDECVNLKGENRSCECGTMNTKPKRTQCTVKHRRTSRTWCKSFAEFLQCIRKLSWSHKEIPIFHRFF